jgi:hypothetical protein
MPIVTEVILRSDTDPLVKDAHFIVCQTIVTPTTAVQPTTYSRVQQFSGWHLSCDQSDSSECAWIGSESAFSQEV